MDFPATVLSDAYILEGSLGIAYAICIPNGGGNPSNSGPANASAERYPRSAVEHLRNVEIELREAQILVSLDRPRRELFTFYRKEDIQRDARSIFSRVDSIVRKHNCHTASKSWLKIADLLRPARARLYHLFLAAVLSALKCVIASDENVTVVDSSHVLLRTHSPVIEPKKADLDSGDHWKLIRLHAQLLPNGQLIATLSHDEANSFETFHTTCSSRGDTTKLTKLDKVLLAWTGQYGRYSGGYIGKLPISTAAGVPASKSVNQTRDLVWEKAWQTTWRNLATEWLRKNNLDFDVDDEWVEVELPLCRAQSLLPTSAERLSSDEKIFCKRIFWPRTLCFTSTVDETAEEPTDSPPIISDDPLEFLANWIASADDREAAAGKLKGDVEKLNRHDHLEGGSMAQSIGGHADAGPSFHQIPFLDGHGVANIYPTPPDGALTQVTDGVLTLDSAGETPGEAMHPVQSVRQDTNAEIIALMEGHGGIGSGVYDEDLFDDVPSQKLREAEMADEPNWDFFDEPDTDDVEKSGYMEVDVLDHVDEATESPPISSKESSFLSDHLSTSELAAGTPGKKSQAYDFRTGTDVTAHKEISVADPTLLHALKAAGTAADSLPLSPKDVKKLLFVGLKGRDISKAAETGRPRSNTGFLPKDGVDGAATLPYLRASDDRYKADGEFWFAAGEGKSVSGGKIAMDRYIIPEVGKPKKEHRVSDLQGPRALGRSLSSPSFEDSEFDSSDFFSNGDKASPTSNLDICETESPADTPISREDTLDFETAALIEEDVIQLLELLRHSGEEEFCNHVHEPLLRPRKPTLPVDRESLLIVAQVVVDQISQSTFQRVESGGPTLGPALHHLDISDHIQHIYGNATAADLAKLSETSATGDPPSNNYGLTDCPISYVRMSRNDTQIDALPIIQPFWEMLSLQPMGGKKSITAFCIHPTGLHVEEGSAAFMQRLNEVYANCNFGSHKAGTIEGSTNRGLMAWDLGESSAMHKLLELCQQLGSSLSIQHPSSENVVVYIVNPFEDLGTLADICGAFLALFTRYANAQKQSNGIELVLQVLPMSLIASPDTIVVPSQGELLGLAFEVYNRCPSSNIPDCAADSGAAMLLTEQIPKTIEFQLTPDVTSPAAKHRERLHLAYSQSADLRWIVACWTDDYGQTALTMSYCLRQEESSAWRPRTDILREMWEISVGIMSKIGRRWHLVVARDGPIQPNEVNEWSLLANQSISNGSKRECNLTLLTFDQHPLLQFYTTQPHNKFQLPAGTAATLGASAVKYWTPGSTPSAAAIGSSPEQMAALTPIPPTPVSSGLVAAPTPPDQSVQHQLHGFDVSADSDAILVDPTDDCWSLVLSFGLNNSHSSLDSRPALSSGFLLKRRGPTENDGLVALGVNLIQTSADTSSAEYTSLLRELIGTWKGLYTLTRTRGLSNPDNVLPWHVRTAVVGQRAVAQVF